jgi:hypothetical protein
MRALGELPPELVEWMTECSRRMEAMRAIGEKDPKSVHDEVVDLSAKFLSLARAFLELSKTARRAAEHMETPESEDCEADSN